MFHSQTWRACSCVALLLSTKRTAALSLASQLHLSRACLPMCLWLSLTSQLTLKNVLASAPLTFTRKSTRCWLHPIREGLPLWHGHLLCSHPALASLILPPGATHPAAQDAHYGLGLLSAWRSSCSATAYWCHTSCWTGRPNGLGSTLSYLFLLWRKFSAQISRSLPSGSTFIKNHCVYLFVIVLGPSVFWYLKQHLIYILWDISI